MRLRNIKNAHDIISKSEYLIKENYKGRYNELFSNNNKLEIEIGMGKGDFIIEKARLNPNINFIGIEKYATVLVSAFKKLENVSLPNLKILNIDASFIEDYFEKEVDKVYLNFSDPWPKKKHQNRRLTSSIFLNKYKNIFKNDYLIEMKTDNMHLFEYSLVSLSNNGYVLESVNLDVHKSLVDNVETEYERKFSNLGYPIYKVVAIHKLNSK